MIALQARVTVEQCSELEKLICKAILQISRWSEAFGNRWKALCEDFDENCSSTDIANGVSTSNLANRRLARVRVAMPKPALERT